MRNSQLTVVAAFKARPGKEEALRIVLQALVAPTLQEEGCLSYDLHESLEDRSQFLFYENWTSRELLDKHLHSSHVQAMLLRKEELCLGAPEITLWEPVST